MRATPQVQPLICTVETRSDGEWLPVLHPATRIDNEHVATSRATPLFSKVQSGRRRRGSAQQGKAVPQTVLRKIGYRPRARPLVVASASVVQSICCLAVPTQSDARYIIRFLRSAAPFLADWQAGCEQIPRNKITDATKDYETWLEPFSQQLRASG